VLLRNYRKDGSAFWNDLFIAPVLDDQGDMTHSVMIVHDVTAAVAHQEELHRLANYDALTGLPNRVLFGERLARVIAEASPSRRPFIVLFADLDQLKFINDTLGHTAGDELLRNVAARLQSCLREDDTIARLGGDEFVIALTRPDLAMMRSPRSSIEFSRLLQNRCRSQAVSSESLAASASAAFPMTGLKRVSFSRMPTLRCISPSASERSNMRRFTRDASRMIDNHGGGPWVERHHVSDRDVSLLRIRKKTFAA
jgi:diguanylate cyclase (GGDEF)-like protein